MFSAYDEYCLWHVPPHIIRFAREVGMAMEVTLGSRANVRKVLEMLDIIESTRFQDVTDVWRDQTIGRLIIIPVRPGVVTITYTTTRGVERR